MLLRERRLWSLAAIPILLSLLAVVAALSFIVAYAGTLYGWATAWIPVLEASAWYAWIWVGPALLGLKLVGLLVFLALAGACLVLAYLLASLIAAPFLDALSQRVEHLVRGQVRDDTEPGVLGLVREGARSLREEARRLAFFLAVTAPLALIGVVVPGAQLVTGPAILAFTIFFLPLDYASYALDRRRLSFADKRSWLLRHAPLVVGFGSAAFLTCAIPLLNFFAMPVLVVAGTLMALRNEPDS